jgi:hypothetical protein
MVNKHFDTNGVEKKILTERERFADESGASLTKRIVEALDVAGETGLFGNDRVARRRENLSVTFQTVSEKERPAAVCGRERIPQKPTSGGGALADLNPDDAPRRALHGEPSPYRSSFGTDV